MQSHGASEVLGLSAFPGEPTSCIEDDEQLSWLKSVLHQVEVMPGMFLQGHLNEGQSIKKMAQALKCSQSSLQLHLQGRLKLLGTLPNAMV